MVRLATGSWSIQLLLLSIMTFTAPVIGQTNETDWFKMGMDFYGQNKFDEAIKAYDNATKVNPRDAEAWNNKGIALGMQRRYDEALRAFEEAVSINSSYAEAWYNMGAIFDLQGKHKAAIQAYNEATKINPQYQKAWVAKNRDINILGMGNYLDFVQQGYS